MPPVRWKVLHFVMAIFVQAAFVTAAQQMQDLISMSSDGWRPIVGTRRQPPTDENSEITHYANPNREVDVVPAEVVNVETTTVPFTQRSIVPSKLYKERKQVSAAKLKNPHKTTNYYQPTGPQHVKKLQAVKKSVMVQSKPRKPVRGQVLAHSSRNEIFVPPPPNTVSGGAYKSIQSSNIKTREAQGFGLLGNNFGITQQNAHIELGRFPLTGEHIIQRPTFFLAKPLQNGEFTRNFVPPPRSRTQQKTKQDTKISLYAFKEGPAIDATSSIAQFGPRPNFVPQVSPAFDFSSQPQHPKFQQQQLKEQAVDVQVTKENLKQYTQSDPSRPAAPTPISPFVTGIPGRNHFPIGYVDYDLQKPRQSQNSPNPMTYEVTEGKWLDTPSQRYQFRPQESYFQFQNLRQAPINARPGLLFHSDISTQRPDVFEAPLVDLNVPAFLPTPYKPENGVIPTSPTQSEAATVFTKVSNKMNRYKTNALKQNPLFFDLKDVSTHYPILGTPDAQSGDGTETPFPMNENGEISNEITTTQKELQKERTRRPTKEPTKATSTRDPTKSRITNRRRPRPRKPSTTTTTEEPVVETYEPMKSQEHIEEEVPVETERPQRRRRPKPRPQPIKPDEEVESKKPAFEETSSKQRGRYRFRTRERPSTERIDTNVGDIVERKRLRPAYSEQQQKHSYEETTETSVEHDQYSYEREPSVEQTYSQESSISDEHTQSQRFETEVPVRQYEPVQELPIQQERRPFIEEIHSTTEHAKTSTTTEQESNTRFHLPENEIDYTTPPQVVLEESREDLTTTTLQPTTTVAVTTTKSTRIRRPSKYDSSSRPRFSVKDYKQRLTQYTSTTPSSTTITQPRNNQDNLRLRFPSRVRTRPSGTTASSRVDEDMTDEPTTTMKSRFRPKDPRHQATTESDLVITEKSVKSVNTRLRPFGRPKMTTEATTVAPKISIRPNLFSARRRSGYPSLKNRIQNKYKKNDTDDENDIETTTYAQNDIDDVEPLSVAETATTELSTTTATDQQQTSEEASTELVDGITEDIMKTDDFMYSQRVSDLTSSFKDYDKPGVFNSVAPTSRSIPNYFTLSTDDPILPIEAFFPNLKEKEKVKQR